MVQDLAKSPGGLINRAFRLLMRRGEARFPPLGLATAQVPVLMALKDGTALSQKELTRIAQIEQPTMALLLARMERDNLIQRTPDPADKRSSLITLTAAAEAKLPHARAALLAGHNEALADFSDEEVETLFQLLSRFVRNLESVIEKQ